MVYHFFFFSSSSSLGLLPSGRSECPTTPFLPLLCFFFEFSISVFHHPVQELLSRPSSSFPPLHFDLHYISLQGIASQYMSYPVLLSCSDCIHQGSFLVHLFQYLFI